ncbi:TetR/AcrR family transcriptional regulator C-terminal domain-containing protein [Streptomyces sp. M10(2022)]
MNASENAPAAISPALSPPAAIPAVADALRTLADRGRLDIPGPELKTAIIQLYALLVFPNLVFGSYGTSIDDDATDRLITGGVDMFLGHYAPGGTPR